jgi:hypothetical protein
LVLTEFLRLVFQHSEGIYWCQAPLRDEDQLNYKVRDVADVQVALVPPIDEYVSDSTVGSDNEAPSTSQRMPSKVVASRPSTLMMERTRSAVSADMTMISSDVETVDVDDGEADIESPKAMTAPSPGKQVVETPHQASKTQGHPASSTNPVGELGSHKRMKKAPPKPCKPGSGRQPSKSRDLLFISLLASAHTLLFD